MGFSPLFAASTTQINVQQVEHDRVLKLANQYLEDQPVTITAYSAKRSAGGLHDYYSEGDYWWPDSTKPDGLPYIRRDGMTNPDIFVKHRKVMRRFSIEVGALVSAYLLTGDQKYADAAIRHLRAWFITDSTRMNPNLNYAQAIPGRTKGRGVGIIDTIHLVEVARAIALLDNAGLFTAGQSSSLHAWFADYNRWLLNSPNGIDERDRENNHGTWWTVQVAEFARLNNDESTMEFCRNRYKTVLLPNQVAPDGKFPLELARTKPYNYSLFNLDGLAMVCQILSTSSDNLWEYSTRDGRSMKKSMEYMYPFIADKSQWPLKPDVMYFDEWPVRQPSLLFAGLAYDNQNYLNLWRRLDPMPKSQEGIRNFPIRYPVLWTYGNK